MSKKIENAIYYSDFGAVGDGVTDDYLAIVSAHEEANAKGLKVFADEGAVYYLPPHKESAVIMTDTDWTGAKFIIDDREINAVGHFAQHVSVFNIPATLPRKELTLGALKPNAANIGAQIGFDALVYIECDEIKQYIRYGANANSGANQQEVLLVKANGDIDDSTPVVWDYPSVTKAFAIPTGEAPLTVCGGEFKTLANEINPDRYISVNRNINITRSNVTVRDIKHTVVQVKPYRAAYGGFFNTSFCHNVLIYNCEIFCHVSSYFDLPRADGSIQKVLLGSYELLGDHCIEIKYEKVVQTNLFEEDGKLHNQGLMGTNFCKNMFFIGSTIARFDAHSGLYNLTVRDSVIQRVNTIGTGTVIIENTEVWGDYMMDLRSDYGGHFNGDVYIKNVTMMNPDNKATVYLGSGSWVNHNFGYKVVQPQHIYVDNLTVKGGADFKLYTEGLDNRPDLTADTVNGEPNKNPVTPTKVIKVISNPSGTVFKVNEGETFKNTQVILP